MHERCAKIKRQTSTLAKGYFYEKCVEPIKGIVAPAEELTYYDQIELMKSFCYLGERFNVSDGEASEKANE